MTIETRFDNGQTIYGIRREVFKEERKCPACDGKGRVTLQDKSVYDCPKCLGMGLLTKRESQLWIWNVHKFVVVQVNASVKPDGTKYVTYWEERGATTRSWHDDDCFGTPEEALLETGERISRFGKDEPIKQT